MPSKQQQADSEIHEDLHLRPYYGDEDATDGLYHSEAKRGTTSFHAYATLYARVTNKRYTLAAKRRRQRQLRPRLAIFDRYRRLIPTEQVTQVRLTGDAL